MDIKQLKDTEKSIICQLSKLGNQKKKDKETFKKVEKLKQTLKVVKIAYANLKEELSKGFVLFDMPRIFQFDHIFFTEEEIRVRYHNKKNNALNRKLDFSLSFETFKSLMSQKECFYTKQKYSFSEDISIDRLDNYKGYVEGNVVSCHVSINQLKDDFSFEEIKSIYDRMNHGLPQKIGNNFSSQQIEAVYKSMEMFMKRKPLEEFTV